MRKQVLAANLKIWQQGMWSGKKHAFYALLRFENGKAVEHWDNIQEIPTKNLANNNSMFGF